MVKVLLVLLKLAGILCAMLFAFWSFGFAFSGISVGDMSPIPAFLIGVGFIVLLILLVRSLLGISSHS